MDFFQAQVPQYRISPSNVILMVEKKSHFVIGHHQKTDITTQLLQVKLPYIVTLHEFH